MLLRPISAPSTTTAGVDAGQLRPEPTEPVDASARRPSDGRSLVAARAVVVQFGAQALGLARSPLAPNPRDALNADDDVEPLHESAFETSEANAARLDALDSNARRARPLAPGTTERESTLLDQPPTPSPSGFFRSSGATGAESLLASDGLDDGLDWLFPGSASSPALDSAFARPHAEFTVESAASELPESATPSLSPPPPRASGFFSSADAAPAASVGADEGAQRAALSGDVSRVQQRYEVDPEGRRYLVAAEVAVDVTPVPGDPAATLRKMDAIRRATSSGSPSSSARDAAAEATRLALQARAQLAAERYAEAREL